MLGSRTIFTKALLVVASLAALVAGDAESMTMGSSQENMIKEKPTYFDIVTDSELVPHPALSFLPPLRKRKCSNPWLKLRRGLQNSRFCCNQRDHEKQNLCCAGCTRSNGLHRPQICKHFQKQRWLYCFALSGSNRSTSDGISILISVGLIKVTGMDQCSFGSWSISLMAIPLSSRTWTPNSWSR